MHLSAPKLDDQDMIASGKTFAVVFDEKVVIFYDDASPTAAATKVVLDESNADTVTSSDNQRSIFGFRTNPYLLCSVVRSLLKM